MAKAKCTIKHCVNNTDGYCQSRIRNWLGRCRFKRRPRRKKIISDTDVLKN